MSRAQELLQALHEATMSEAMMSMKPVSSEDKPIILGLLKPLGFKLRMKVFPGTCRLNIDSEMDTAKMQQIADILNKAGYQPAGGGGFSPNNFNGPKELFIRGKDLQPLTRTK